MRASTELDNLLDAGTNFHTEPDGADGHTHADAVGGFSYYVCGNRYRTHTCQGPSINADLLESEVVDCVRQYLDNMDISDEARRIADMVNGSTPDLRAERMELADINAKLANGLKALLNGFDDIPELHDEMDRLRVPRLDKTAGDLESCTYHVLRTSATGKIPDFVRNQEFLILFASFCSGCGHAKTV